MDKENLISIHKLSKELGVSTQTLRNWDKKEKLKPVKLGNSKYRYYRREDVLKLRKNVQQEDKKIIGYCRVSSKKQKDDLERQIENVKTYMLAKGYNFEIITDIGSGINYQKPGLLKLIDLINNGIVEKIVILYKDRLLRFGFELLEYFAKLNSCKIEIIDNTEKTEEQELVEDLIQIITVFSCKLQGKRVKRTKELMEALKLND